MKTIKSKAIDHICAVLVLASAILMFNAASAFAQITAFKQSVAEAASDDQDISAFYREAGYEPVWTGSTNQHRERRAELFRALDGAEIHGLSAARYKTAELKNQMKAARSVRDLGQIEVKLSKVFLRYARDIQTGMLVPSRVDSGLVLTVPYRDRLSHLKELTMGKPRPLFNSLVPQSAQYRNLMKEKLRLETLLSQGGWGQAVQSSALKPGQSGPDVVALRNRLIRMGYMSRSASSAYDSQLQQAVRVFQQRHGLSIDGVAGNGTLREINVSVEDRLKSVIVAMERERWLNMDLGDRHVMVNQTDFTAQIVDNGQVTFQTRSVIGKDTSDRRSPEFSDEMEFMVINPSWYVPRSIVTKEYLPQLRNNPNAVGHIEITDRRGRKVNRGSVNFSKYTAGNFPFSMRQPPSSRNALGLVKFMFPNKYNIYLHDTPSKSLFDREVRAFSHGCIRLADPFDFAYALLAKQTDNPKGDFHRILNSGRETRVNLEQKVPVHITYRTALVDEKGNLEFRRDVYGRDAKIWKALSDAGVTLSAVRG